MRNRQCAQLVCATALMLTCAIGGGRAADRPDAWVTTKTKVSLMTADGIDTKDLHVDTVKGVVTLHGKVSSEEQKAKAGDVARSVDGAKDVKNLLQVVPKSQFAVVERSDDAVKNEHRSGL